MSSNVLMEVNLFVVLFLPLSPLAVKMILLNRTSSSILKPLLLGEKERSITSREEAMTGRATEVVRGKMVQGCCHTLRDRQGMVVSDVPLLPPGGHAGFVSAVLRWRNTWSSLLVNM